MDMDFYATTGSRNQADITARFRKFQKVLFVLFQKDPARTKAIMDSLGEELKKLEDMGKNPIVITSPIVRLYFKKLASDYYKDIIVISYNEVESNIELQSVGMVTA